MMRAWCRISVLYVIFIACLGPACSAPETSDGHQSIYKNSYALLIGINKYPNLPPRVQLKWAVNDVNSLKAVLVEIYGFPAENVKVLTDEAATRQEIIRALASLADKRKVGSNDRIFIYFSGHGQTVKTKDGAMGFLLPSDAEVDFDDTENPGPYLATAIGMQSVLGLSRC